MTDLIAEAVRFVVIIEKRSYDLYRKAAMTLQDPAAKDIFEKLAREESENIDVLLRRHPGTWYSEIQYGAGRVAEADAIPKEAQGGTLPDQLRLALLDKRLGVDLYLTFARTFREPSLCKVFETAHDMAKKQLQFITDQHRVADSRMQAPLQRRAKRNHLRTDLHRIVPNKHSELYFSMLDTGRQSQLG
ncbi:MAG TPA: ferritin [Geobacter sp.]|nr:ferritin [Geobacter sp.]